METAVDVMLLKNLEDQFKKLNIKKIDWLIILIHAYIPNSNVISEPKWNTIHLSNKNGRNADKKGSSIHIANYPNWDNKAGNSRVNVELIKTF